MCQALFLALGIQQWTQQFLPTCMWHSSVRQAEGVLFTRPYEAG